jgi:AI-2 transport protein TqsA
MQNTDERTTSTAIDQRSATATAAVVVLAVLAVGATVTFLGPVLKPFLLAVFLYYVAHFGVNTLVRLGLGQRAAYLGLLLLLLLASTLIGQLVSREALTFRTRWPDYERKITRLIDDLPQLEDFLPWISEPAAGEADDPADQGTVAAEQASDDAARDKAGANEVNPRLPPNRSADGLYTDMFRGASKQAIDYLFAHGLEFAEVFTLVLVYLIFLFMGSRRLPGKIARGFPGERGKKLLRIGTGIGESMERFMAVKTIVGLGMGATAGLIMAALGLDYWLLWAFVFFAANYITYIGSIAACIPPILLGFVALPTTTAAILLAVLLIVNRLVWIDFVEIKMSGQQLNLDPTLMFLWLAYWGWMWGVLGLLLAYPMLVAVKIVVAHVKGAEGWAILLSDE